MRLALLAVVTLGLSACAATHVSHEVTAFHAWPDNIAQRSFRFAPRPDDVDALKWQTWRDIIGVELRNAGFVQAERPALEISFQYQIKPRELRYRRTVYLAPTLYYGRHFRHGALHFSGPLWWGGLPPTIDDRVTVAEHELTLSIKDIRAVEAVKVFEGTSVSRSRENRGALALPLLVRAMTADFPGRSGEVRRVRIAREKAGKRP